jgi:hypothetical protein
MSRMATITKETLRAFLHDTLPDEQAAEVEKQLRTEPKLRDLYELVRVEEDRGEHSIGAIWRRNHLSCPTRDQLGGYLLQALDEDLLQYIGFHMNEIGCSFCTANLEDLQRKQAEATGPAKTRRKKIVNSSADLLKHVSKPS